MADTLHELSELVAAMMKKTPIRPMQFYYPPWLVEQAAELFDNQDCYINGYDGSQYYHGLQTKPPDLRAYLMSYELTDRLNARIATMDLPDYLRRVFPKQNTLYRLDLLYRNRYMVYRGRRGYGKSAIDMKYLEMFRDICDFRDNMKPAFERKLLGQWHFKDEGD